MLFGVAPSPSVNSVEISWKRGRNVEALAARATAAAGRWFEDDVIGVGGERIEEIGLLFFCQNRECGIRTHKHDLQVKPPPGLMNVHKFGLGLRTERFHWRENTDERNEIANVCDSTY